MITRADLLRCEYCTDRERCIKELKATGTNVCRPWRPIIPLQPLQERYSLAEHVMAIVLAQKYIEKVNKVAAGEG